MTFEYALEILSKTERKSNSGFSVYLKSHTSRLRIVSFFNIG